MSGVWFYLINILLAKRQKTSFVNESYLSTVSAAGVTLHENVPPVLSKTIDIVNNNNNNNYYYYYYYLFFIIIIIITKKATQ